MLQMLIERGALERENGTWTISDDYGEASLPDSVHGVVAARIDLLEPAAREALRRCSVVGRVFWPAAVGLDDELVAGLEKRGLVSQRPTSVVAGIREFVFKHSVTRDVAYSTLPRSERRVLHRRVAEWIEGVAPDRGLETLELTAYHYAEAIAYGEDDPELVRRAFELLLAAGNGAADRSAFEAAAPRLQRALELATSDTQRAAAELGLARFGFFSGDMEGARRRLARAENLLPPEEVQLRADVLAWRSRVCWTLGRWDEALTSANAAVDALAGLPESPQLARALARRSQIEMLRGLPEAAQHARETIAVAQRVGDAFAAVNARINEVTAEAIHGVVPDPAELLAIVDAAQQIGSTEEIYRALVNFTWSSTGYLPVAQIERTLADARSRAGDATPPAFIGIYLDMSIAMMLLVPSGRWSEAETALATPPAPRDATVRLLWLSVVSALALRRGDLELAERLLDELRPMALASGEPQRIVPMANVAVPWTVVRGQPDLLHSFSEDVIAAVDDQWSAVLSCLPIVRAVAAAEDPNLLERFTASMARRDIGPSSLANSVRAAEGLLALMRGDPATAVARLTEAADRERSLGNVFFAACLDLDLARALERAGDRAGAEGARGRAGSVLEPLGCVNPF
jgi:tetratricopeptide (TPR) repeat protein